MRCLGTPKRNLLRVSSRESGLLLTRTSTLNFEGSRRNKFSFSSIIDMKLAADRAKSYGHL